jgi:uncharacterized protein YjbJ (UPF0337 family)
MTDNTQPNTASSTASPGMRGEIVTKWGKFDAREIAALKDMDELVSQIQSKYGRDKTQAQREVDAFAKGRQL